MCVYVVMVVVVELVHFGGEYPHGKKTNKQKKHYTVAKKMKCSKCNFAIEILDRWLFLI